MCVRPLSTSETRTKRNVIACYYGVHGLSLIQSFT